MKIFISNAFSETQDMAFNFAKEFKGGVIALEGELGAGKTTFTQGFAKGLGITERIISPTFVLIRQHLIPGKKAYLYHVDLYRLGDEESLKQLGLEEIIQNPDNVVLIEWAKKATKFLPKKKTTVRLKILDENKREIKIIPF